METNPTQLTSNKSVSDLRLRFLIYPSLPVCDDTVLSALHSAINRHLPIWGSELKTGKHEDVKAMIYVDKVDTLAKAVDHAAPVRQEIGVRSVVLKGAYNSIVFYLVSCTETLPPELNCITIDVCGAAWGEDRSLLGWAPDFFEEILKAISVRYATVHLSEEWDSKNLINDEQGTRAVGVKLDVSLPGLYWLNYFGRPYLDLIGEDRLLSAPALSARTLGNGVLVALDKSPVNWQTRAYREREEATIIHIGSDYFFLRDKAYRPISPDFRCQ
jgi:hypothetical protein